MVAHVVGGSLSGYHYASRPVDDDLATAWIDRYLNALDPAHLFLLQGDVSDFRRRASSFDDDLRKSQPGLDLPFAVWTRYTERASEVYGLAARLLDEPASFDDPAAAVQVDREEAPFPADVAAREQLWRGRVRAQVLDLMLEGYDEAAAKALLKKRYERQAKAVATRRASDVLEIALTALAEEYDPHSAYLSPSSSDDFDIRMRDALEGIGAELRDEDGLTRITRLIPGGPAMRSGELAAGDHIFAVAQGASAPVDVVDMDLDEVVKLIRGTKGTEVRLTVRPGSAADPAERKIVTLVRDRVVLESASAKLHMHTVARPGDAPLQVGIIEVPSFYLDGWAARRGDPDARSTTNDTRKLVQQAKSQGAAAIVLDLRGNGGGALSEAQSLAGLFIDRGPVVQVKDPSRGVDVLEDPIRGVTWSGPLVVLTDELSASASEIVAGAIQDHRRGIVVGAPQTHGKGTVQQVIDLEQVLAGTQPADVAKQSGALKLTVQKFYRVSGASTQHKGVVPDVLLPSPWQGLDVLESDLDNALPYDEIARARYTPLPMEVDLGALRVASTARVASDPVFGWLAEDLAERTAREKDGTLSLHRPTREQEVAKRQAALNARRAAVGLGIQQTPKAGEFVDEEQRDLDDVLNDAILKEALHVTADFTRSWKKPASLDAAEIAR
jgi:carboxyl-terminal processing protease